MSTLIILTLALCLIASLVWSACLWIMLREAIEGEDEALRREADGSRICVELLKESYECRTKDSDGRSA